MKSPLPSGWRMVTLNDLQADEPRAITDGPFGSNLTSSHYTESGARVIRLQNIGEGRFVDAAAYVSMDHFKRLQAHEARAGDLVVASLGESVPRACLVPEALGPAIVKADCIRVRLNQAVEPRWVLYAMQTPALRRWAADQLHGVGRPRLGLKIIRALPIPLPPFEEQRRIVDILEDHLSRLDASDGYLKAAARRCRALQKAILLSLIPEAPPADWRWLSVADAGQVDLGRQRHPDWHFGPEMRPYLRVANVFENRIDTSDVMEMDFSGVFDRYRLEVGDVLLNEGQSPHLLGRPAIYRGVPSDVAFTNSLLRFRANADVLPEWALLVFRRHMHSGRFARESRITTNIAHLSSARFKSVEFPLPPLEQQRRIVALADERLAYVERVEADIAGASQRNSDLRRALLQAAFTGRLAGELPDGETVEELAYV